MPILNERDMKALAQLLDQRATQLRGEVQSSKEADRSDREGFEGVAGDMVDLAERKHGGDLRHAESERDRLELIEIANARERMARGTYGECTDCGEPIALARLKVEPWASRCIECEERYEKTHPSSVPLVATGQDLDTPQG